MPLPHFLLIVATAILLAGLTVWVSVSAGVPLMALALVALIAAGVLRLSMRNHDHEG